jgi:hypothetical protein
LPISSLSWPPRRSTITVAATALDELPSEALAALINVGALERHDVRHAVLTAGDGSPTFQDLTWHPDQKAYGYFDACDGSVVVAPESQMLFRVALPWWLAWLAASLVLTNSGKPTELVPASAWDIGDLWVSRHRKVPLIFARRLRNGETLRALQQALQMRSGRNGGVILTSTRRCPPQPLAHFETVSISDLLTSDAQVFSIDRDLLLSPFSAGRAPNPGLPLQLAPDGRALVINGDVTVNFRGEIQIKLIRLLVAAYYENRRYRASELLDDAGSQVRSLERGFGGKKWKVLAPFISSRDGLWGFDL